MASERNKSMICLAAALTEHYFFNGIFIDGKKVAHKKNKNEFYDFQKKLWFS